MAFTVDGSNGLTFPDSTTMASATALGMRNRIINGAMTIDQRNAGGTVSTGVGPGAGYSLDRWSHYVSGGGVFSIQRSTTAPSGFTNSYLATVTTADSSIGASDQYQVRQVIEGFNAIDLGWGSASAKTITISFWVRSSVTGTYSISVRNYDVTRSYVAEYTISSANTWEYKTITISGDTTGTWNVDNSGFCFVTWSLGAGSSSETTANVWSAGNYIATSGSVDWISTNGATFYLTGVQFERGTQATPFEWRPYTVMLSLCQRYCYKADKALSLVYSVDTLYAPVITFPTTMRTAPTMSDATFSVLSGSAGTPTVSSGATGINTSADGLWIYNSAGNWTTTGNNRASLNAIFSAEL